MKTISYYELLELIKNGAEPKRIRVKVCSYSCEYVAEYDVEDFSHYYIANENQVDDNYKYFLSECFFESMMFGKCIEIIEEVEEDEFVDIEELNLDTDELLKKVVITAQDYVLEGKINKLIKNQKKIINEIKNKD